MEQTTFHLPRSQPEEQGISSTAVIAFLNAIKERQLEVHSLMLLRHGRVTAEGWWAPYAPDIPHMLFSLSKSFTSTAIGFAAAEGKLSLDDEVISFFPEEAPEEAGTNLTSMRIRHLLMMGTGHALDTTDGMHQSADGNWVKAFLQVPVEHEPGTHFIYNSGATYMLAAILQKVTGQTLLDYLQPRLLEPLGIEGATWETCPRGIQIGGWGLSITTEDIAKFGQLYLQRGVWNSQRLLSEAWIDEATSKQIANGDGGASDWAQGYGYQFWRCRHGLYRGDGAFGQFCIVMPEHDAVLAMTSGTNDLQGVMDAVWDHLLPAMKQEPLPPDESAQAKLAAELKSLTLPIPQLQMDSRLEETVSGNVYSLEDNNEHWNKVVISFAGNQASFVISNLENEYTINLGRGEWVEGKTSFLQVEEKRIAASFTWLQEDTLELTMRLIETPFAFTSQIVFKEDALVWSRHSNVQPASNDIRGQVTGTV
ncbi:CubicO group peptidase (beta-lactamase class C family) [Paenibacillus endophyticus]|uniref:CubicO group peptidase (Beta-lactamase class C family) n=1 Tax=Paenibacillus endophyticus TaxID=1294268 RepID=A0A7W5GD32_9BACL|nr:serine hydrolase [Paenibacillus endophyticus]MBB3155516.1 CubicO group peptidase (beta-lactamase class C family) [Paenibacillus endophyticus]